MASSITWLDTSSLEQRRMREILGYFTEKDSLEELGLGQMRDALGDALFPGTSTLHTRARYLLFIPWIYQMVARRGGNMAQARNQELALIKALTSNGRNDVGIIGSSAGSTLKTMPSSVYWSALGAYGILSDPKLSREQALSWTPKVHSLGQHEPSQGAQTAWRSTIPSPPEGFPQEAPHGMALRPSEAAWLQERILDNAQDTLLAHLVIHPPHQDSAVPWEDPVALTANARALSALDHGRRFSQTMHGAQLLYNLLIAESYEAEGFTRLHGRSEHFTKQLEAWSATHAEGEPWRDWDIDEFFTLVTHTRGRPVASRGEMFVRAWVEELKRSDPLSIALNTAARDLIRNREKQNKGQMARIGNPKRLEPWGGSSGAGRYVYRWGFAQALLKDIHEGLQASDQAPSTPSTTPGAMTDA